MATGKLVMHKNGKRQYLVWLLLASLLIAGCSGRFWYNRADWLIGWYVDDYIDFTREQQSSFDEHIDAHMRWHRVNELPRYVAYLDQLQLDMASPMGADLIEKHANRLWDFWRDFMREALPEIQLLLQELSDEQCAEMMANVQKSQQELGQEYGELDEKEVQEKRSKQMQKTLRRWIGRLQPAQEQLIEAWAQSLTNTYPAWIENQKHWGQYLEKALNERREEEGFTQALELLLVRPDDLWDEPYQQLSRTNRQHTYQLLADIQQSLTPDQREHLLKRVQKWREDFYILATTAEKPTYATQMTGQNEL